MIQWPWLMIFLVLISTVQWTCIKAQYPYEHNLNWREYSLLPKEYYTRTKRTSSLVQDTTTPITMDSNTYKNEPRAIITTTNVRISTTNLTKSITTREQPSNNSTIHVSNGLKIPQSKSSSIVVFPNSAKEAVNRMSVNKFIPDQQIIDKCSKNDSYCDEVDNYPRQDLQQIFRTSKLMSSGLFGIDAITDLETRISTNVEPQPICGSLEQIVYPEAGLNKNNEWRFIVQGPNDESNNYRQGIRVEKCINSGEPCKFSENLPSGYTTTCVQKYIYRKLVAIKDTKEIYYDSFRLPSCCVCMFTVDLQLLTRTGIDQSSQRFDSDKRLDEMSIKEPLKRKHV